MLAPQPELHQSPAVPNVISKLLMERADDPVWKFTISSMPSEAEHALTKMPSTLGHWANDEKAIKEENKNKKDNLNLIFVAKVCAV